jgi:predicted RNase H-like HicB family nuclease
MHRARQRRFTVRVAQYPDNGWFLGQVVELPGCCTRAPDLDTLREKVVEAIQVYLESFENLVPTRPFETYQVVRVS